MRYKNLKLNQGGLLLPSILEYQDRMELQYPCTHVKYLEEELQMYRLVGRINYRLKKLAVRAIKSGSWP